MGAQQIQSVSLQDMLMPVQASPLTLQDGALDASAKPERRLHKRHPLTLIGRFMRADRHEFACQLEDISVGDMTLLSPVQPDIGENVIVYIDELGRLEGAVMRTFEGGFAASITATRYKREKLAARITWLINRHELNNADTRSHERVLPNQGTNALKLSEGVILTVRLIDVSLSGANIETEARPPIGSDVWLGKLRAEVIRHHDRGIGIRFITVQEQEHLSSNFG